MIHLTITSDRRGEGKSTTAFALLKTLLPDSILVTHLPTEYMWRMAVKAGVHRTDVHRYVIIANTKDRATEILRGRNEKYVIWDLD